MRDCALRNKFFGIFFELNCKKCTFSIFFWSQNSTIRGSEKFFFNKFSRSRISVSWKNYLFLLQIFVVIAKYSMILCLWWIYRVDVSAVSLSLSLSTGLVFIWFLVSDWPRESSNKFLTWSVIQADLKPLNLIEGKSELKLANILLVKSFLRFFRRRIVSSSLLTKFSKVSKSCEIFCCSR